MKNYNHIALTAEQIGEGLDISFYEKLIKRHNGNVRVSNIINTGDMVIPCVLEIEGLGSEATERHVHEELYGLDLNFNELLASKGWKIPNGLEFE